MRLNKYIAQAGICSRRKADELTVLGKVKINGVIMKEPGYDVSDSDIVEVEGRKIKPETKFSYYMLNKPVGYITSLDDDKNRPVVTDLLEGVSQRVFPVGRLDYNTSGLLIMTNDGELAHKLTHPSHHIGKTYHVVVEGMVSHAKARRMEKGIDIGGFVTSQSEIEIIRQGEHSSVVIIKIFEGKNRQVRKMFSIVGNKVIELERIAIGDLKMAHLKPGKFRKLSENEIEYLKRL